jgi:FkbM family methyltransferase
MLASGQEDREPQTTNQNSFTTKLEGDVLVTTFRDHEFLFYSTPTAPILINEIFSDNYRVLENSHNINFQPGDIVLDVGANEGVFSIMLAKLYPQIQIIAFEPVPETYFSLLRNIGLSGCTNITPYNIGLGAPGQPTTTIYTNKDGSNSGGASACLTPIPTSHLPITVALTSLDEAFTHYHIPTCKLLKMDVEGMEYEILYGSKKLSLVSFFAGEIHFNRKLEYRTYRPHALATWISNQCRVLNIEMCKMCE